MTKFSIGLLVSSLLFACSSPAAPDGPGDPGGTETACTVTISGAVTAIKPCIIAAVDDDEGLHFGLSTTDGTVGFASNLPGTSISSGSYPLAATTKTITSVAQGTAVWAEFYDDGQHPNQGDATFSFSGVGQSYTGASGTAWSGEHGTLTATLEAADPFASGTVTVTASF